jgi:hypothetical protein
VGPTVALDLAPEHSLAGEQLDLCPNATATKSARTSNLACCLVRYRLAKPIRLLRAGADKTCVQLQGGSAQPIVEANYVYLLKYVYLQEHRAVTLLTPASSAVTRSIAQESVAAKPRGTPPLSDACLPAAAPRAQLHRFGCPLVGKPMALGAGTQSLDGG